MKLADLDELIVRVIAESEHPEIVAVEVVPTAEQPNNHTRLRIDFADSSAAYVMIGEVRGSRANSREAFTVPQGVL